MLRAVRRFCLAACLVASGAFDTAGQISAAPNYEEGQQAYLRGDYRGALAHWQPLAEAGHPAAMTWLAWHYEKGYGVPREPGKAIALYRQAAERGLTYAMRKLGVHYLLGEIVEPDPGLALAWRLRAAEAGDAKAQHEAAVQLQHGIGVERDLERAVSWLRKAAEGGVDEARWDLATLLIDPESAYYDLDGAITLYRHLGFQGDLDAKIELFWLYQKGDLVPRDLGEARHWGHRIAAQDAILGEMLLALNTLAKKRDTASLKALVATVIRLVQDSASRPDRGELRADALDRLCGIAALDVRNAEEAAQREEVLRDVSAFLDSLRAQGEDPCP